MKLTTFNLDHREYHLLLNGEALFDCYDHFGKDCSLADVVAASDKNGYQDMVWMLVEFATQGELYRRYQGFDPQPFLREQEARLLLKPTDIFALKAALEETLRYGFAREHYDQDGEDVYLEEIERKKAPAAESRGPSISGLLRGYLASHFVRG